MESSTSNRAQPSLRRDPRIDLTPGTASVEFAWERQDSERFCGEVASISATGLSLFLEDRPAIEVGTMLTSATVRIGDRTVQGDLNVRFWRAAEGSRIELGCLFYPDSLEDATSWMLSVKRLPGDCATPPLQLGFRCSNCHWAVWVSVTDPSSHECPFCKQTYCFEKPNRQFDYEELHRRARDRAEQLEIDLPSAVSILLGLLTPGEVRDILAETPPAVLPGDARGDDRELWFDKGFLPAIEAGTITKIQASQRGRRESFAKGLVARHRISLDDAYAVADNRTSLLNLLRERSAGEPITAMKGSPSSPARVVAMAAMSGIALMVGVGIVQHFDDVLNGPAPEPVLPRTASAAHPAGIEATSMPDPPKAPDLANLPVESYARVRTNDHGEILFVEATHPGNVLLAFCKSQGPHRQLEPVDVVPTDPPSDTERIGLLRDPDEAEVYRVVVIRRDPQTRRWFLGNMGNPHARVSVSPAPQWLEQAASDSL